MVPGMTATHTTTDTAALSDPVAEDKLLGALIAADTTERLDLLSKMGARPLFTHPVRATTAEVIGMLSRQPAIPTEKIRHELMERGFDVSADGTPILDWLLDVEMRAPYNPEGRRAVLDGLVRVADRRTLFKAIETQAQRLLSGEPVVNVANTLASLGSYATMHEERQDLFDFVDEAITDTFDYVQGGGKVQWSTGSHKCDQVIRGIVPGHMTVIAARPGVGKTVVALQWAVALAQQGAGVMFFALEMSGADLMKRVGAQTARFNVREAAARHDMEAADKFGTELLAVAEGWNKNLVIMDSRGRSLTAERIATEVRRQKALWEAQGVQPVAFVVDYLQRIPSSRAGQSEYERVSEASLVLSGLAKETGMALLACCQLKRTDTVMAHDPTIDQLRSSGQLEQDADNILLLHRPEMTGQGTDKDQYKFIFAKTRHDEPKTVERYANLAYYRIEDDTMWNHATPNHNDTPAVPFTPRHTDTPAVPFTPRDNDTTSASFTPGDNDTTSASFTPRYGGTW